MMTFNYRIAIVVLGIAMALTSCTSKPSLQQYFVDSQEKEGFVTTTIPKSVLGLNVANMSESSQEAYNSINKVNVLYYPIDNSDISTFEKEHLVLKDILKSDHYKTLMKHKDDGMNIQVVYEGNTDDIDEFIVYGMMDKAGLGVARILGDDMNIGSIMKMMEELKDIDVDLDSSGMIDILKDIRKDSDMDDAELEKMIEKRVEEATKSI